MRFNYFKYYVTLSGRDKYKCELSFILLGWSLKWTVLGQLLVVDDRSLSSDRLLSSFRPASFVLVTQVKIQLWNNPCYVTNVVRLVSVTDKLGVI